MVLWFIEIQKWAAVGSSPDRPAEWLDLLAVSFGFIQAISIFLQATTPPEERHDITVLYNKMTLSELQENFSFNVSSGHMF